MGFIPFPKVLAQCEMQSVSSRIWARIAVSISYDDNHYTTDTPNKEFIGIGFKNLWNYFFIFGWAEHNFVGYAAIFHCFSLVYSPDLL